MTQMSPTAQVAKEKLVYLRQWVGNKVAVKLVNGGGYAGVLTNIVFDGTRLMYIMIDDTICLNFDHVLEVKLGT